MEQNLPSIHSDGKHKKSFEKSPLIEITRIMRTPLEWIWNAWSDAEIIKLWWGPKGYISKNATTDFRVGGKYLFDMEAPDEKIIWSTGFYEEIIPQKKIVYSDQFSDKDGNTISGNDIGMRGDWPKKLYVTIEFEKIDSDQTKMVISHEGIPKEMHDEYVEDWNQSLDKFQDIVERYGDEYLKTINMNH